MAIPCLELEHPKRVGRLLGNRHLQGESPREAGNEQRFQSDSVKCKRVLSLWRLGLEYWRSGAALISRRNLEKVEQALRDEVHYQTQGLG